MAEATILSPEVTSLLAEAAEWRLLGLLFEYPTDRWRGQVSALIPDLREPALVELAESALALASEGLHIALFGPGGTVPVREVTYQGGVQFGYLMAELSAYYEAFGYHPALEEADDHLAVELGFVAYLKLKQAMAEGCGDEEKARITADAAAEFIGNHLAVSVEPVTGKLENFAPEYLIRTGRRMLEHTGPAPKTVFPFISPPCEADDGGEMTCGEPAVPADGR